MIKQKKAISVGRTIKVMPENKNTTKAISRTKSNTKPKAKSKSNAKLKKIKPMKVDKAVSPEQILFISRAQIKDFLTLFFEKNLFYLYYFHYSHNLPHLTLKEKNKFFKDFLSYLKKFVYHIYLQFKQNNYKLIKISDKTIPMNFKNFLDLFFYDLDIKDLKDTLISY